MRVSAVLPLLVLLLTFLSSLPTPAHSQLGTMRLTALTLNAPFPIRQEAGVAVYPRSLTFRSASSGQTLTWPAGFIVLYGGESTALPAQNRSLNDVWLTQDGTQWHLVSGTANGVTATSTRNLVDYARTADCQDDAGGLYLVGGSTRSPTVHGSNVSYSSDVVNWDHYTNQAFWRRQRSTCTVNAQRQVFVVGGLTHVNGAAAATASNDIWMSANVGGNGGWTLVTARAEWYRRQGMNADFFYNSYLGVELLYVMNGYDGTPRWNDIWVSTNHGLSFARVNAAAPYKGRMDARVTFTKAGAMIVSSGDCGDTCNANDVWASLDGGYTWGNCCDGPLCGFTVREDHVQALDSAGRLLIFSGSQQNPAGPDTNDVWRSTLNFDVTAEIQRGCNLKAPQGGVGLRCVPGGYCPTPPYGGAGVKMNFVGYAPWAAPRFEGGVMINPKPLVFVGVDGVRRSWPAGALIMWGGRRTYSAAPYNDVWAVMPTASTTAIPDWQLIGGYDAVSGVASRDGTARIMQDRARTADCYDPTSGKIYMVAGSTQANEKTSDVWMSSDAGMSWAQIGTAPFMAREAAACTVDSKGQVFVMGGSFSDSEGNFLNDVWMSANGGQTWRPRNAAAPFPPRTQADAETVFSATLNADIVYFANGYGSKAGSANRLNDIWVSSTSGQSWTQLTAEAPYYGRQDGELTSTASGALLVVAGDTGLNQPGNTNDIWASLNGGYTWGLCNMTAGFVVREDHVAIVDRLGYLWVMQGEAPDTPQQNDVWRSERSLSDTTLASLCKLKVPVCGVGLKCWPNNQRCIDHCPPEAFESSSSGEDVPVPTPSSGLSAGYIVLIVAAVLAVLTIGYWLYKKNAQQPDKLDGGDLSTSLTGGSTSSSATGAYHQMEHGNTNGQV